MSAGQCHSPDGVEGGHEYGDEGRRALHGTQTIDVGSAELAAQTMSGSPHRHASPKKANRHPTATVHDAATRQEAAAAPAWQQARASSSLWPTTGLPLAGHVLAGKAQPAAPTRHGDHQPDRGQRADRAHSVAVLHAQGGRREFRIVRWDAEWALQRESQGARCCLLRLSCM